MADENETTEAQVEETPAAEAEAPEAAATETEAPEASSEDSAPESAEAETPAKEPEVQLTPKERKVAIKAAKSAKVGTRPARSAEERQAERDALRAKKAIARKRQRAQAREKYKAGAHERTATPAREHEHGIQKVRQGIVVSDKADKTITVRIDVARRHRKYGKIVRSSVTVHAHDESNDANSGDTVVVREARPLSRTKRWRLVQVVERAK
jgi:small subunit ribosomal protein S17